MRFRGPAILQLLFRRRGDGTALPAVRLPRCRRSRSGARARPAAGGRASAGRGSCARSRRRSPPAPARAAALDALAAGGTAVVATGQQVGLFLGPLYGFYKAASAVAVARALDAESGVRCVPLFWLQTEDHDFAEIASASVATSDGKPRAARARRRRRVGGARVGGPPAASRGRGRVAARRARRGARPDGRRGRDAGAAARRTTGAGRPIAAAFAGAMAALFADEGLLFFDPRDARVARARRADVTGAPSRRAGHLARRLRSAAPRWRRPGSTTQIPCRPDCALLLLPPRRPAGDRFRLARRSDAPGRAGAWGLSGRDDVITAEPRSTHALAREPLRFSTSALLRPILQDTPAADGGVRRRPGRGELLRPARRRSTTRSG